MWKRFAKALGAKELIDASGARDADAALAEPQGAQRAHQRGHQDQEPAHWIAALNKAGVPCGPINTIDRTFAEPQVQHLGIARGIKHPKLGEIKVVGNPINLTASPQPRKLKPTPELGQHNDAVLKGLGVSPKKIKELRAAG